MRVSDPIADLLTRIRNGLHAKHRYVDIPWSNIKESIARILEEKGFVAKVLVKKEKSIGTIRVYLKYGSKRTPVIQGLKRVSRPGCRKYVSRDKIPKFFGGLGLPILSTSKGIKAADDATSLNIGGELLCLVW